MRFANPQWLWLLGLVPLLIVGFAWRRGWRRHLLATLGDQAMLEKMTRSLSPLRRALKTISWLVALSLITISLARPQAGERITTAKKVGIDIVVALDFSKSMLARDAYPSRIERAKAELNRLIDTLTGDRVGLVAFAGETLSYPLTTDYSAAKLFWRDMSPQDMPVGGTALGKAIIASLRLLKALRSKGPPRSQVILLLTDGEDHEGDPLAAAKKAADLGVQIFTVGIGSQSGEPIPEIDKDGKIVGYLSKDGRPVTSRLDAGLLRKIAEKTRASYIEVEARTFGVDAIIDVLTTLKRSEIDARLIRHYDEIYAWFLFPGIFLLLAESLINDRRSIWPRKRARTKKHATG